ncbi:MAG: hypothetical protein JWP86_727 [Phenylobacterium sp.]|nr:hypothetical protein [Phenylobacterium sp.]MDB5493390.1 hypothetical protein [Phenylobacterium sp.]
MSSYNPRQQQPVRRELTDGRSSAGPAPQGGRKPILNDTRSTRARPAGR